MRKAISKQGTHLVDMKTEPELDCTYALLEWRMNIPVSFQKDTEFNRGGEGPSNTATVSRLGRKMLSVWVSESSIREG